MFADEGGYFALNPLSRNCANAMVVMPERQLTRAAREVDETLRRRAAELGRGIRSLEGAERIGARIAIGPLSFNVAGCVAPGALLVGDAAGTLDPFMGQGVYLAVTGALDAAVAVSGAIAAPRRERALFASYERARKRELRARRRLALLVGTIARFTDSGALRLAVQNLKQGLPAGPITAVDHLGGPAYEADAEKTAAIHISWKDYTAYVTLTVVNAATPSSKALEALAKVLTETY